MKTSDSDLEYDNLPPASQKCYVFSIEESMHQRIEKLIRLLNHVDVKKHTRQQFFTDAFIAKIESGHKMTHPQSKFKEKRLRFDVNHRMYEKIEEEITGIKKIKKRYSKKEWFLEAIREQLEREERKAMELYTKASDKKIDQ